MIQIDNALRAETKRKKELLLYAVMMKCEFNLTFEEKK
jgi:hypothetical protein